jgi:hypothetical protein
VQDDTFYGLCPPPHASKFVHGKWICTAKAVYQQYICPGQRCKKQVRSHCACAPGHWLCADCFQKLLHSVAASLHKVSSCTVDCRLVLALAALIVLSCFSIVIGRIALASLTSFCSWTLQTMVSRTNKKMRGKFV